MRVTQSGQVSCALRKEAPTLASIDKLMMLFIILVSTWMGALGVGSLSGVVSRWSPLVGWCFRVLLRKTNPLVRLCDVGSKRYDALLDIQRCMLLAM